MRYESHWEDRPHMPDELTMRVDGIGTDRATTEQSVGIAIVPQPLVQVVFTGVVPISGETPSMFAGWLPIQVAGYLYGQLRAMIETLGPQALAQFISESDQALMDARAQIRKENNGTGL